MSLIKEEKGEDDSPASYWCNKEHQNSVLDYVKYCEQNFRCEQRQEWQVFVERLEYRVVLFCRFNVVVSRQELNKASSKYASNDDRQRKLEKHHLMEAIPPAEGSRDEFSFDESSPNKEKSGMAIEDLMKRPRTSSCVNTPKHDWIKDFVDTCKDEIFLDKVAPVLRRNFGSSQLSICG